MSKERPDYADTLEGQIILDLVGSGKTLVYACGQVGQNYTDVFRKIRENPKFKDLMEEARNSGYEIIAEDCLAIADEASFDTIETERGLKPNKEWMQRSKLRVETRLKLLAKWHPHRYGEKLQVEQKTATVAIPVSDDPIAAQRAYEELMKGS